MGKRNRLVMVVAALVSIAATLPAARADTDPYEWARLRHKPVSLASLSAVYDQPERFLTQAVEMTGRVTGTMVLDGAVLTTVVLKLDSGETVQLLARPEQQLFPVGQAVRVIACLTAPPAEVAEFNLLAMTAAAASKKEAAPSNPFLEAIKARAYLARHRIVNRPVVENPDWPVLGVPGVARENAIALVLPRSGQPPVCAIRRGASLCVREQWKTFYGVLMEDGTSAWVPKRSVTLKPALEGVKVWASGVNYKAIGHPEAYTIILNYTRKRLDAYEVDIYCYDNFGRPVKRYGYGTNRFRGIGQFAPEDAIPPGGFDSRTWTLYGHENTTRIKAMVVRAHFRDNTVWTPGRKAKKAKRR